MQLTEKGIALGPEDLSLGQDVSGIGAYLLGLLFRGAALVEMGRFGGDCFRLDVRRGVSKSGWSDIRRLSCRSAKRLTESFH